MNRRNFINNLLVALAGIGQGVLSWFRKPELGRHYYVVRHAYNPKTIRQIVPIFYVRQPCKREDLLKTGPAWTL